MSKQIWFTSDEHRGHGRIIEYANRPFSSVEEMNSTLTQRLLERMKPGDTCYHLGDLAFHTPPEVLKSWARSLPGEHILITGNHDHEKGARQSLPPSWRVIYRILETKIEDIQVTLCHYPMLSWQASFHGAFQLHGHTHGTIPFDPQVRRLDVGVDCWDYYPVSWQTIKEKLLAVPTPKELKNGNED